jgi:hypothetical protein
LGERGQLEDLGIERTVILKCTLKKYDMWAWTGLICLAIEPSGVIFLTRQWTIRFHEMWRIN